MYSTEQKLCRPKQVAPLFFQCIFGSFDFKQPPTAAPALNSKL